MNRLKSLLISARPHVLPLALILITTAVVFLPVLWCDLVDFDDPSYINTDTWVIRPISWKSVAALWNQSVLQLWHPLTSLTLHVVYQFSGLSPWGFHAATLLFHLGSAALIYVLFAMLTGSRWRSACLALVWAIHPLRVESVAWAAEIKDTGSVFFALACMICYVIHVRRRSWTAMGISTLFLGVSMLYKPMLMTMPGLLLLLDFWPLGRTPLNEADRFESVPASSPSAFASSPSSPPIRTESWLFLLVEKIPLFIVAFGIIGYVMWLKRHDDFTGQGITIFPLWLRLANVPISYVRYIWKMVWFDGLTYHYTMPPSWPLWQVIVSSLLLIGMTTAAWAFRQNKPMILTGWLWFLIVIFPVSGITQVSDYSMADRYTYFASVGLLVMAFFSVPRRYFEPRPAWRAAVGLSIVVTLILGLSTRNQISHWRNGMALYAWGYEVDPNDTLSHIGLAGACIVSKRYDLATKHLHEAIRLDPRSAQAHYRLSVLLALEGRRDEAMKEALITTQVAPRLPTGWHQTAELLLLHHDYAKAVENFQRAQEAQPDSPGLLTNLATACVLAGQDDKAIDAYQKALDMDAEPESEVRWNLAMALTRRHRLAEAKEQFARASALNPNGHSPDLSLGVELVRNRQWRAGLEQLGLVLKAHPDDFDALLYSGIALGHLGRIDDALTRIDRTIQSGHASAAAHDAMADLLGHIGRVSEAIGHLDAADRLDPNNPVRNAIRRSFVAATANGTTQPTATGPASTQPALARPEPTRPDPSQPAPTQGR